MSDSSDEDVITPVALREKVQNADLSLLPEKSRLKYMKAFDQFNTWRHKKGEKTFSETVILSYFIDLAKSMKPSTLWSIFSMLKATLKLKKDVHIEKYPKLMAFIKKTASGHKPKKSKIFTAADITKYLSEAPDSEHLGTKVALIIGISGACRTQELTYLKTSNVEKHSETLLLCKIPDTKTNTERNFVVRDEYMEVVKKYQNLRPPKTTTDRFFLGYRKGKCINQPMGPNKIGSLPREIATFLGLTSPEQYTGHCFRRTSATLLADAGADLTSLKRHAVAERYLEDSIENKSKTCKDSNLSSPEPDEPQDPLKKGILEQCRFCGEFRKDCIDLTTDPKPYLERYKTSLTVNSLSVELDFNDDKLPKTVCCKCDEKLQGFTDFVKNVIDAQDSLINVAEFDTLVVKVEAETEDKDGNDDPLELSEVFTLKRKKPEPKQKRKAKQSDNSELDQQDGTDETAQGNSVNASENTVFIHKRKNVTKENTVKRKNFKIDIPLKRNNVHDQSDNFQLIDPQESVSNITCEDIVFITDIKVENIEIEDSHEKLHLELEEVDNKPDKAELASNAFVYEMSKS